MNNSSLIGTKSSREDFMSELLSNLTFFPMESEHNRKTEREVR